MSRIDQLMSVIWRDLRHIWASLYSWKGAALVLLVAADLVILLGLGVDLDRLLVILALAMSAGLALALPFLISALDDRRGGWIELQRKGCGPLEIFWARFLFSSAIGVCVGSTAIAARALLGGGLHQTRALLVLMTGLCLLSSALSTTLGSNMPAWRATLVVVVLLVGLPWAIVLMRPWLPPLEHETIVRFSGGVAVVLGGGALLLALVGSLAFARFGFETKAAE